MDHALGHGQRARAHVDGPPQLTLGGHRHPHPLGRLLQALAGLSLAALTIFDGTEHGVERVQVQRSDVHITEEGARKGLQRLGRFHQPPQHRVRGHLKPAGGGTYDSALRQARPHVVEALD
jgi:hypothetical protein